MKFRLLPLLFLSGALLFSGCASISQTETASLRSHGVREELLYRMQKGKPLTPPDIIELSHHGASDELLVRYIREWGVNYLVNREDVRELVAAHINPRVIDALVEEGRDFAMRYSPVPPGYGYYYGPWDGGVWGVGFGYGGGYYHHWR